MQWANKMKGYEVLCGLWTQTEAQHMEDARRDRVSRRVTKPDGSQGKDVFRIQLRSARGEYQIR